MCIYCDNKAPDDDVIMELIYKLENPQFDEWKKDTITDLCVSRIGFNGEESQNLSIRLLEDYISWRERSIAFSNCPTVEFVRYEYEKVNNIYEQRGFKSSTDLLHEWLKYNDNNNKYTLISCVML